MSGLSNLCFGISNVGILKAQMFYNRILAVEFKIDPLIKKYQLRSSMRMLHTIVHADQEFRRNILPVFWQLVTLA